MCEQASGSKKCEGLIIYSHHILVRDEAKYEVWPSDKKIDFCQLLLKASLIPS